MVFGLFEKVAVSGFAAAAAIGASLVSSATVDPQPAYPMQAFKIEAAAAATNAARLFDRADLDNNGALDREEFEILAIVTAELAQLNGFVSIDAGNGIETIAVAREGTKVLETSDKARIRERALREFRATAGDDERLTADEFVDAQLEQFLSSDADRNGVLAGGELKSFGYAQSKLATYTS